MYHNKVPSKKLDRGLLFGMPNKGGKHRMHREKAVWGQCFLEGPDNVHLAVDILMKQINSA